MLSRRPRSRRSTIKVNLKAAEGYGIKPGDVRRASAALVAGTEVGDIFRNGKAYDVNVWSTPETRNDLNAIRGLLIDTPKGGHVRLEDVADVNIVPTPNMIKREQMMRKIDVGAKVRGRDLGSVVADVKQALATVEFPREYHPELLGEFAEREAAQKQIQGFAVISAIGILLLVAGLLRKLAPGDAGLPGVARGARGRLVGGVFRRRDHRARVAGRIPDRTGDRGAQRHHADQPLSAPRDQGRRSLRLRSRHPRRARAHLAYHDDGVDDCAHACTSLARRQHSRSMKSSIRWRSSS